MRNRLLSGWRQFVLYAVVASFALTPVFSGAKDELTPLIDGQQSSQGIQQADRGGQEAVGNVEPATLYARSNYLWPYPTTYGSVDSKQLRAQGVLRTMVGAMRIDELGMRPSAVMSGSSAVDWPSLLDRCSSDWLMGQRGKETGGPRQASDRCKRPIRRPRRSCQDILPNHAWGPDLPGKHPARQTRSPGWGSSVGRFSFGAGGAAG